ATGPLHRSSWSPRVPCGRGDFCWGIASGGDGGRSLTTNNTNHTNNNKNINAPLGILVRSLCMKGHMIPLEDGKPVLQLPESLELSGSYRGPPSRAFNPLWRHSTTWTTPPNARYSLRAARR